MLLLPPLVVERAELVLPPVVPVTTSSPDWRPLVTTVLVPSVLPSWTGTRMGVPSRSTTRKVGAAPFWLPAAPFCPTAAPFCPTAAPFWPD
jgi:hypothetical protein